MIKKTLSFIALTAASVAAKAEIGEIYETCDMAQNGEDCVNYPYETCQMTQLNPESTIEQPVCQHKYLLPLLKSEIFPTIFLPLLLGIASVAGVGGGMVVVPITIGLFHFSSKEAIAISSAIVFETAIIRFAFFSAWTKHPEAPERTEIDYNTVSIVYPLFLVGSYMGIIFYIILSELWITILIIAILGTLSIQMIFKSRQKFMAESKKIAADAAKQLDDDYQAAPAAEVPTGTENDTPGQAESEKDEDFQPLLDDKAELQELATIKDREKSACSQWSVHLQTVGLTALSVFINMIRGSPKNESIIGMAKCGAASWSLLVGFTILCLIVTWYNVRFVKREHSLKRKHGALCASDIDVQDNKTLAWILFMSFVGSFLGNTLGLGGGFIYNPVQIGLGVAPSVAASTSMYMIMFSAIASTILLVIYGQVNMAYVLYLACSCGVGVILGMYFIGKLLKRWNRQSIVAICLAVILVLATGFSGVMNIMSLKQQSENGMDIYTGGDLC